MGANTKLLALVMLLMNLILVAFSQTTPEERCTAAGDNVCFDCFRRGTCVANGDGTFSVENLVACSATNPSDYCDDSSFPSGPFGLCAPLSPSSTRCGCSSTNNCVADPNNPNAVLHCESNTPFTDNPCPSSTINLNTCSCLSCSGTCPLVDDPSDDCAKYYECTETGLIPQTCADNSCFDQASCSCVERPICPSGCPLVDDPRDDCTSYFVCNGTALIPFDCVSGLCFDQSSCGCVEERGTTIEPPTTMTAPTGPTPSSCPAGCPFVDNPNDNCKKFFICDGDTLIPAECPGRLCFDQSSCQCR